MKIEVGNIYVQKQTGIKMKVLKYSGNYMDKKYYIVEDIKTKNKWVECEITFIKKPIVV